MHIHIRTQIYIYTQVEVASLQSEKERLVRDCRSAESEVEKLAREGPGTHSLSLIFE